MLAAPLFASLLQVHSVSYADFLQSLVSGNLLGGKRLACKCLQNLARDCLGCAPITSLVFSRTEASGKSGEIFWRTRDHRYVLKTVSEQEVGQLIKMLPEYKDASAVAQAASVTHWTRALLKFPICSLTCSAL